MKSDYECDLCENEETLPNLQHNCFLLEVGRSFRMYQTCNPCAAQLRAISTDWYHIFTDKEIASLREV